jgi:hypothetical protein
VAFQRAKTIRFPGKGTFLKDWKMRTPNILGQLRRNEKHDYGMKLMPNKSIKATGNRPRRLLAEVSTPAPYFCGWAGTKQNGCPRRTLGAELRSSRLVSAPRQKKKEIDKHK